MSADRALPGFEPLPDGDDPLGQLAACHERLGRQLRTLERLLPHLARLAANGQPADDEARTAAAGILRYFEQAAPRHHRDEEDDLFPALLEAMAGSDAVCLRALTEALTAQHRELDRLWQRLRPQLRAIADGASEFDGPLAADFVQLNRDHAAREDAELLPMAARLLSESQVTAIGSAMRARRDR